jgi:type I restriction enzyme, S subunit
VIELPPGWTLATLGDLIATDGALTDGDWVETKDQDPNGNVRLTQLADVGEGAFRDRSSRFLRDDQATTLNCTFLQPNDVLIARMPDPLARACVFPGLPQPAVTVVDVCIVRPGVNSVDPRWLMWTINAPQFRTRVLGLQSGTTRRRISRKNLGTINFPVPPVNEQRRIAAAIEEHVSRVDAADASLARVIERMDSIKSGLITSLVEQEAWPRVPWKEIGRSQNGRAFPSRDYSSTGIKLLRPGNLHASGRVEWNTKNTRLLPERYAAEYQGFIVAENEIVMNLTAQSLKDEFLGRVCLTSPGERCLLNQRIARLSPTGADPRFVLYAFKTRRFRQFVNGLNKGSLIQHMFTSQLAEYELPLPELEEQQRIVTEVEARLSVMDATRVSLERARRRSASLRRAVLERAFHGELVPQNPTDEPATLLLERIRVERAAAQSAGHRRRVKA